MRIKDILLHLGCLFVCFIVCIVEGYRLQKHVMQGRSRFSLQAALDATILGAAGGVAEVIALELERLNEEIKSPMQDVIVVLDQRPSSPLLQSSKKVRVYYGDMQSGSLLNLQTGKSVNADPKSLFESRIVVAVDDAGDPDLRGEVIEKSKDRPNQGVNLITNSLKVLPTTVTSVLCGLSAAIEKDASRGLGAVFGPRGSLALQKWSDTNKIPFTAIKFGELIGGVPGQEPVPFRGLPLIEPDLHPSYALLSVVGSSASANPYASTEKCTRDALGKALARLAMLQRSDASLRAAGSDALLISIPGTPPTEKDWSTLFKRIIATGSDVELLRIDFRKVLKGPQFTSWIADIWFPNAIVEANAATILAGARPVRAVKVSADTVRIQWEDLQQDLTVKSAGSLDVKLVINADDSSPSFISVIRNSPKILPGEAQLVDELQKSINVNAYKKGFVTPLTSV